VVVARPADGVVERHWQARWKYAFLHSRRAHGSRTSWVALPTGVERQCQAAIGAYVRRRVRDRVDGAHKTRGGVRESTTTTTVWLWRARSGVPQQQGLMVAAPSYSPETVWRRPISVDSSERRFRLVR